MEISIQVSPQEIIALGVHSNDSIADLKNKIKDKKGFPVGKQSIFYRGEVLNDDRTVRDYNIQNRSILNLTLEGKFKYPNIYAGIELENTRTITDLQ